MKIQYKPIYLPRAPKRYRYIVIHDVNCMCEKFNDFRNDTSIFQTNKLRARLRQDKKWFELPYHFVCEKINDDFETISARPIHYSCEDCYPNMDKLYSRFGIHICVMGNFNVMVGDTRMYQQMCYRAITPMMKTFRIYKSNIVLHGEIEPSEIQCPGFNFNLSHLKSCISPYLIASPM